MDVASFDTVWKLASLGELDGLKNVIENKGASVELSDTRGFTPLAWAARNGHYETVIYLNEELASSSPREVASFGGLRPLHHAVNKNHERVIRRLLFGPKSVNPDAELPPGWQPANVNCTDENNDTPLHYAASRGVLNIVLALCEANATIQIANSQGTTPLHKAVSNGNFTVVRRLLDLGADVNAADKVGDTSLHLAARGGFPTIVKLLLDVPTIDRTLKNAAGYTAEELALTPAVVKIFQPEENNAQ